METLFDSQSLKRKVAIYIRVSTTEQKIDGYGLEAQQTRLLGYINSNPGLNYETKKEWIFCDTHSGSDINRNGLNDLREKIKEKKFDAVLVWKIDRLSRSLKHLLILFEELEKNDVSFISVQENIDFRGPIGKLVFQMFGAIAQFERELIKGRTQMGKIASAEMGNFVGTAIPYGYKAVPNKNGKGKKIDIVLEEKKYVERMFKWYIFDGLGLGQIAKKLNVLKVPKNKRSKLSASGKWTEPMVRNIIHNTIYRGFHVANKKDDNGSLLPQDKWTIVVVPPCVSEFVFQQAQNISQTKKGGNTKVEYLMSGKLRDMTVDPSKSFTGAKRSKGGYSYRRKQFKKDGVHYPVFEIPAKQIEAYVWGKIIEALKSPDVFIKNYLSKEYADPDKIILLETELKNLRQAKVNNELGIERVEKAYESGTYSEEKMAAKIREITEQIVTEEIRMNEISDELNIMASVDIEVAKLKEASAQVKYKLENLTQIQKKILVSLFVDRVEMRRLKENNHWKIMAEIYFRFNPNKFLTPVIEGRTNKSLQLNKNAKLIPTEGISGARERT